MVFRRTIAAKIFGLAIILLLLTIALAGFLLYEVTRTKQDLTVVANFDVPLTQSLARLHEFGLRRRLAFERWFGALNAAEPNREVVAEATENYAVFTRKLTDEFSTARRIIDAYPRNAPGSHTLAEVETLLDQIQPAYKTINNRQQEVLDMQREGQHDEANAKGGIRPPERGGVCEPGGAVRGTLHKNTSFQGQYGAHGGAAGLPAGRGAGEKRP